MSRILFAGMAATAIFAGVWTTMVPAQAQDEAPKTGIQGERQKLMKGMGGAMGAVAKMFKGEAPFDAAKVEEAADLLIEHAQRIEDVFPDTEESRLIGPNTEALPVVWEQWDAFVEKANALEEAGTQLKTAASTAGGDMAAVQPAFAEVADACKACHTDFRKAKQ